VACPFVGFLSASLVIPDGYGDGVCEARFDDWGKRGRVVVGDFSSRGLPWFWWVTPSTTSPLLEAELKAAGMTRTPCPGMYMDLGTWEASPVPDGVEVVVVSPRAPGAVEPDEVNVHHFIDKQLAGPCPMGSTTWPTTKAGSQ
jgi:hypothetical protein